MIAQCAARGDNSAARVLPDPMALAALLNESMLCHDGGDGVASCHGSVLVGEDGQAGDCLVTVAIGVCTRQPLGFDGDGQLLPHGLLSGLCLATCPHDAAGGEVGCHGEDHRGGGSVG